jgi:outer membrane lipoprotein-sorting protein
MNTNNAIKAVVLTLFLITGESTHAFVGAIAVGLGQMNDDVGEILTSFAADATVETEEMTVTTRIYYKPGMVRDEIDMGGQKMVTIRRFDKNKVWMLMGQGMYMEIDPEQGNQQVPEYKLISRELIGPETVNGMATIKYKSVYETKDGKFGGFTWFTEDNIAVRGFLISETKGEKQRIKFEFTSLERNAQPDSLFELPPGAKKLNMGGFGGMPDMSQMGGAGNYGVPPPASAAPGISASDPGDDDGAGFAGEVADEAQQTAEDTAKEETVREVRDSVRKGIGKLFGR